MEKKYAGSVITRAHFADFLLEKKIIKSRNEAFDRYIGTNGPCYVPREKMEPAQAIQIIHNAGGVAILAHPVLLHLGRIQMQKLMTYLCDSGIDALEAIYSTYTMGEEIQMRKLAKENHLIISGGSDYHGANKPNLEIGIGRGRLAVPYDVLSAIQSIRDARQSLL
jgi:predicted metal-dependent phosphoesterase TrpH